MMGTWVPPGHRADALADREPVEPRHAHVEQQAVGGASASNAASAAAPSFATIT
jgi:hypothetical protein